MTAAAKPKKAVVAFFDPKKPHATVSGDSIARYVQNGRHFDLEGFVVHDHHASLPQAEAIDQHDRHKEDQRVAREAAKKLAAASSESLGDLLGDEPEMAVEEPETGWDEKSVTEKFKHRMPDVLQLAALSNSAINQACKRGDLEFNPQNGKNAKWENIHSLLSSTEPGAESAKGDQTGDDEGDGDGGGDTD